MGSFRTAGSFRFHQERIIDISDPSPNRRGEDEESGGEFRHLCFSPCLWASVVQRSLVFAFKAGGVYDKHSAASTFTKASIPNYDFIAQLSPRHFRSVSHSYAAGRGRGRYSSHRDRSDLRRRAHSSTRSPLSIHSLL